MMSTSSMRKLAARLRGGPWPGENLRAADALEDAATQLDALAERFVKRDVLISASDSTATEVPE
jgi:hypothetical protein